MEEKENRPVAAAPVQESESPQRSSGAPVRASAGPQASLRAPAPVAAPAALDPLISIDNLAERLHRAMDGPGTDEEQLFLALQQVQGYPAAIKALRATYLHKYKMPLDEALHAELTPGELAYAMSLLDGRTGKQVEQTRSPQELARRLYRLLQADECKPEFIYEALGSIRRDLVAASEVNMAYYNEHKTTFTADFRKLFGEGAELDLVMDMVGGAPMRANVEQNVFTPAQAKQIFDDLAKLKFITDKGTEAAVPYHHPADGCHLRAQMMAQRLTGLGIASQKVFAVSSKEGQLNVMTPYAGDSKDHDPNVAVSWWFHVAPMILVQTEQEGIQEMVLDPSLYHRPLTVDDWIDFQSTEQFSRLDAASAMRMLSEKKEEILSTRKKNYVEPEKVPKQQHVYPRAANHTFVADRDTILPGDIVAPLSPHRAQAVLELGRRGMSRYAMLAQVNDLALAIRKQLDAPAFDLAKILQLLRSQSPEIRLLLLDGSEPDYFYGHKYLILEVFQRCNHLEKQTLMDALLRRD